MIWHDLQPLLDDHRLGLDGDDDDDRIEGNQQQQVKATNDDPGSLP